MRSSQLNSIVFCMFRLSLIFDRFEHNTRFEHLLTAIAARDPDILHYIWDQRLKCRVFRVKSAVSSVLYTEICAHYHCLMLFFFGQGSSLGIVRATLFLFTDHVRRRKEGMLSVVFVCPQPPPPPKDHTVRTSGRISQEGRTTLPLHLARSSLEWSIR